jgi:hypothetical protein
VTGMLKVGQWPQHSYAHAPSNAGITAASGSTHAPAVSLSLSLSPTSETAAGAAREAAAPSQAVSAHTDSVHLCPASERTTTPQPTRHSTHRTFLVTTHTALIVRIPESLSFLKSPAAMLLDLVDLKGSSLVLLPGAERRACACAARSAWQAGGQSNAGWQPACTLRTMSMAAGRHSNAGCQDPLGVDIQPP